MEPEFKPWGKTPRFAGFGCTITEKLDGTNALVHITDEGKLFAGSRNRWLTPGKTSDNYGFAAWCLENEAELVKLGPGWHYGEWWGQGIGRGYGPPPVLHALFGTMGPKHARGFSLFDTRRFGAHNPNTPACCSVVPVLYEGAFRGDVQTATLEQLKLTGSVAAPGFMNVEGVIILLHQTGQRFKLLAEHHDKHKFQQQESV